MTAGCLTPRTAGGGNRAKTQEQPTSPKPTAIAKRPAKPPPKPAKIEPLPIHPEDIRKARSLVDRGLTAYRRGMYDKAEAALKEAIGRYPFMAEANLALGKIFLIRGSAQRDMALIQSARLMFEMARAMDPSLREVTVLLELFRRGGDGPGSPRSALVR